MPKILIVDDEQFARSTLRLLFENEGFTVDEARDAQEAVEKISNDVYDVVLTDLKMKNTDGIFVLKRAKEISASTEVIVLTAYGTVSSAVEAMKLGAFEYLTKPFDSEELLLKTQRAVEHGKLMRETGRMRSELKQRFDFTNLIAVSDEMKKVIDLVEQVAKTDSTILIEGESGTGKGLIARLIHFKSQRSSNQFVSINCGALPESLLESELFGHVKGSFTGAINNKKGLFEEADKGTLVLDEVSAMSQQTQVKLLNAIQDHEIRRVGSNIVIKVDTRIIAITNKNLKQLVKENVFREDLYYRLSVIPIVISPLRERKADILPLAEFFIRKFSKEFNKDLKGADERVKNALLNYHWPGNVRELENVIERCVVLAKKDVLTLDDLPADVRYPSSSENFIDIISRTQPPPLKEIEREYIRNVLIKVNFDKTKAAQILKISRSTLARKIKQYDLKATS